MAYISADPQTMSMPIQRQISALEPELPVYNALTMDQILGKTSASQVSRPIWCWPLPPCRFFWRRSASMECSPI